MFYKQLDMSVEDAYDYASEVMTCNMMADDVGEGIDAFIEKHQAVWRSLLIPIIIIVLLR